MLVCQGCGAVPPEGAPFRCINFGTDDVDHVVVRRLSPQAIVREGDDNPYIRYRERFCAYHVAREHGLADERYVQLVRELDEQVAEVDGTGFVKTPLFLDEGLVGGVQTWVKNETGNVSGSHKARHLFGVMVHLRVLEAIGVLENRAPLAISSCGNAAMAAAAVAKAARWPLSVFVPESASQFVLTKLESLDANINVCSRDPGQTGDPCTIAFREAVSAGAIPFSCQGSDNGIAVEGGLSLGYELATELPLVDHIFVQVGGGALASAVFGGYREAAAAGQIAKLPRFHTVQTEGAYPLRRALEKVQSGLPETRNTARIIARMSHVRAHRSEVMWPWEEEPHSIAHGILDDETYDWAALVEGMLLSGGRAWVVSEDRIREAFARSRATDVSPSFTGVAGLAGLIEAKESGIVNPGESALVLFTGIDRQNDGSGSSSENESRPS